MKFLIITPSFNQLDFLKRCIASVRDQVATGVRLEALGVGGGEPSAINHQQSTGLTVHHHVQDGGSMDGTREFLAEHLANSCQLTANSYTFSYESTPDNGMYDALNRGVKLAIEGTRRKALGTSGQEQKTSSFTPPTSNCTDDSIVAWLNCDEQYLPGTLEFVGEYFDRHPEVDILFGDYLMVDEKGEMLAFRKGCTPRLRYIQASHLNNLSCAMFFRSAVFQGLEGFDSQYKAVADEDFVVRALTAGFRARHVRSYFSVFTFTGSNLGGGAEGQKDFAALKMQTPWFPKLFRVPLNLSRWIEKVLRGTYLQRFPLSYSIYVRDADARNEFTSLRAGWKWPTAG